MNTKPKWLFLMFLFGKLTTAYAGILHTAVESEELSQVISALKQIDKNRIDDGDKDGYTALDLAVRTNQPEMVKALLDAGADIRAGNKNIGGTPLMTAAFEIHDEIFKLLLERGADINARDKTGRTVIRFINSEPMLRVIRKWSIEKRIRITNPEDVEKLDHGIAGSYMKDFRAGSESQHTCKPQDYFLVVEPFAGLSNRLRVLASSWVVSLLTGRKLVVNWKILPNEMPAKWDELFSYPPLTMFEQSPLSSQGCSLEVMKASWKNDPVIKTFSNMNISNYWGSLLIGSKEPIIYLGTSLNFQPNQADISENEYKRVYRQFYKNLRPAGFAVAEIKEFQEKYFTNKFPIGIHYRSWQAGPADYYVKSDPQNRYLDDFIIKMRESIQAHPDAIFFLATDDPNVKEKMLKVDELKGRIVTREVEIERSTIKGQLSALVDWFLLGSTNFIIGTKDSSFSDEAAHLTKEDRKISIGESAFSR